MNLTSIETFFFTFYAFRNARMIRVFVNACDVDIIIKVAEDIDCAKNVKKK